jgi:hypothetical protein
LGGEEGVVGEGGRMGWGAGVGGEAGFGVVGVGWGCVVGVWGGGERASRRGGGGRLGQFIPDPRFLPGSSAP